MTKTEIRRTSPVLTRVFAKELKSRPGDYLPVPTNSKDHSAVVSQINRGHRAASFPPGEFQARLFKGRAYVCYMGPQATENAPTREVAGKSAPGPTSDHQVTIFDTPEQRPSRNLAEVVAAADQLAFDAALRADDMRSRGAERGAALMGLMAETHSAYARTLRGLSPTA